MTPVHVTVAICTRNRAASLALTLASLERLAPPGRAWDVLVVDNASSDATPWVIAAFAGRLPLRGAVEPRAGLSHARNRAVAAAHGAYLAWTDDDVRVDPGWLVAYVAAFARWPAAALFGGRIVPVLAPPAAAWAQEALTLLEHPFAARDFGDAPLPLADPDRLPFGANYAVRTDVQRQFPYDPRLGAAPGRLRLGEETAMMRAMLRAGHAGRWVPQARVDHLIGPERQTLASVRRYFAAAGETAALLAGSDAPRILGVPRWLWRRRATRFLSWQAARLAPPPARLARLIALAQDEGAFAYWRRQAAGR